MNVNDLLWKMYCYSHMNNGKNYDNVVGFCQAIIDVYYTCCKDDVDGLQKLKDRLNFYINLGPTYFCR